MVPHFAPGAADDIHIPLDPTFLASFRSVLSDTSVSPALRAAALQLPPYQVLIAFRHCIRSPRLSPNVCRSYRVTSPKSTRRQYVQRDCISSANSLTLCPLSSCRSIRRRARPAQGVMTWARATADACLRCASSSYQRLATATTSFSGNCLQVRLPASRANIPPPKHIIVPDHPAPRTLAGADNMTDRSCALQCLCKIGGPLSQKALDLFAREWADNDLVVGLRVFSG